ncbi:MAG: hypothetical protein IEMM0008_0504 [bacterium]|nr:MAG: hypothetical protein IEMM0008_0504 [bacterium]
MKTLSILSLVLMMALSSCSSQTKSSSAGYLDSGQRNTQAAIPFIARGKSHMKLKDYHAAINDFTTAISYDNLSREAYYFRAISFLNLGRHQRSIQDISWIISVLEQIKSKRKTIAGFYFFRGNVHLRIRQYNLAITDFTHVIRLIPGNPMAYNNRSDTYMKIGDFQKALKDANKTIQLAPKAPIGYVTRGEVYNMLNKYKKAIKDFKRAIKLNSKTAIAYKRRAATYAYLGRCRAIKDYKKYLKLGKGKISPAEKKYIKKQIKAIKANCK